jgi:alkylation response protein AidB-like acyl-CoA dehydrogenase
MSTFLNDELSMLRDGAKAWVRDNWPVQAGREMRRQPGRQDDYLALHAQMAELGWTGILVPEGYGGSPLGHVGIGIVLEELGRHVVPSPFLSSAVGVTVAILRGTSDVLRHQYLPDLVKGKARGALAIDDTPACAPLQASRSGNGWLLSGVKRPILFGSAADLIIVDACIPSQGGVAREAALFVINAAAKGIHRRALSQIDSQDAAEYRFASVEVDAGQMLAPFRPVNELRARVLDSVRAGLAAEMLGMGSQAFEITLDYLKVRKQFDRAIGSFQALQHRAAYIYGELQMTRTAVEESLLALDADSEQAPELTSIAKAMAGETLQLVCNEMIQMHGGIAMTEEHDAGTYLKRARVAEAMFGTSGFHRERFGRLNGY